MTNPNIEQTKDYEEGKSDERKRILEEFDDWFDGRGNMERWEWIKLKSNISEEKK